MRNEKGQFVGGHTINVGIKRTEETKRRMSLARINTHPTEETRRKLSLAHLGKSNGPHTIETKWKISLSKIVGRLSRAVIKEKKIRVSHIPSKETRKKISLANSGDRGPNWKGNNVGYLGIHIWLYK